ncbi:hypothetical protein [Streptomyces sp. CoH17]|uniref:hypothetical protein n=1 Tax=Streptomyces sp. CoH17 TaxID=2992806 RepID=UPI002271AB7E|nr:hypothetical protein [Streptomyces sp. CoH17]
MATSFPGSDDVFNVPNAPQTTPLASGGSGTRTHTTSHKDLGDAIAAIQNNSSVFKHAHDGTDGTSKLSQANTHQNTDTNTVNGIHHTLGTGATNYSAGSHNHANSPIPSSSVMGLDAEIDIVKNSLIKKFSAFQGYNKTLQLMTTNAAPTVTFYNLTVNNTTSEAFPIILTMAGAELYTLVSTEDSTNQSFRFSVLGSRQSNFATYDRVCNWYGGMKTAVRYSGGSYSFAAGVVVQPGTTFFRWIGEKLDEKLGSIGLHAVDQFGIENIFDTKNSGPVMIVERLH